ncbi:MAG: hypothetical protein HOG74_02815 [Nitrospina sp.]|nr:hypothetical protein [Nitrospina sp.]
MQLESRNTSITNLRMKASWT